VDSATLLLLGLLFSSLGLGYLVYGRRQKHKVAFYTGISLMVFPYFVADVAQMLVVGVLLMAVPRFLEL
jgi:hypothetical protein